MLSYAKHYWKPGHAPADGVGLLAKTCYESIANVFPKDEIIYLDASEYRKLRGIKDVDACFAVSSSIDKLIGICKPESSTLISVNESSLLRRTIRDHARKKGWNANYLTAQDGIESNLGEIRNVDFILGFGAWSLFKSYTSIGVDPAKVFPIGWHYWSKFEASSPERFGRKILAYLGAISYRKGIDRVIEIVHFINEAFPDYWLELVGTVWNPHWKQELEGLRTRFPRNFVWREERIEYGKKNWLNLKNEVCFAIFPSYEEGLSGCALDVINLGIPLFHSDRTGIEASHESVSMMNFDSYDWKSKFAGLIAGGSKLWREVAEEQRRLAFHQNHYNTSPSKAIKRIANGHIWPTASIDIEIAQLTPIKTNSFIQNLMSSSTPEYQISRSCLETDNSVNVHYESRKPMNEVESIQMALYLAEKYNNFSRVVFAQEGGSSIDLVVKNLSPTNSSQVGKNANLFFKEYRIYYLNRAFGIRSLKIRELVRTRVRAVNYKLMRLLNMSRLKIRLQLSMKRGQGNEGLQ